MSDKAINFLTDVFIIALVAFAYLSIRVEEALRSYMFWGGIISGILAVVFGFIHDEQRIKKEEGSETVRIDELMRENKALTEEIARLKQVMEKNSEKELIDKA